MGVGEITGVVTVFALAGAVAGAGARALLARLRRGTRIGPPVCEVTVAMGWAGVGALAALAGGDALRWVPALLALGWLGVAASVVDVRHRRLPDALTLPALPAAFLVLAPLGSPAIWRGLAGAALAFAVHAAVHLARPAALGAGDVKLAAPLGAVLAAGSWPALWLAAVLAALLTTAAALVAALVARARGDPRTPGVPHGPSMLLATAVISAAAAVGAGSG